jgi:hypothetical protein
VSVVMGVDAGPNTMVSSTPSSNSGLTAPAK